MPYTKNTWSDRSVERPLTFTQTTNADGSITLIPAEGTIVATGTPITSDKLNNLEQQYDQAVADVEAYVNGGGGFTSSNNANGTIVKFADGTMHCWASFSAKAGTGTQNTGVITFPANFVATPYILVTHSSLAGNFAQFYVYGAAINGFTLYHIGINNVDLTGTSFRYLAVGKWK